MMPRRGQLGHEVLVEGVADAGVNGVDGQGVQCLSSVV